MRLVTPLVPDRSGRPTTARLPPHRGARRRWRLPLAAALAMALGLGAGTAARAQMILVPVEPAPPAAAAAASAGLSAEERQALLLAKAEKLTRANSSVVGVRSTAVEDAVSNGSLGRERQGSGVVIEDGGLVLTIGYLILEAEQVEIEIGGGRVFPARVVAYDQATGFGLVQALVPLPVPTAPLGRSSMLRADEPLMISSGGARGDLSLARLVSKRPFSGYWEYHIDDALFTSPPRGDHSGAALFNADGELLGIGSLVVSDASGPGQPQMMGNMFVPIDLLRPVLGEMRQLGASRSSHRAWMGVNCVERAGEVRVVKVNDDSPADAAGLQAGDQIVAIDGNAVQGLEGFYKALWSGSKADREVKLDIRRDGAMQTVKVQATDRQHSLRRAKGI